MLRSRERPMIIQVLSFARAARLCSGRPNRRFGIVKSDPDVSVKRLGKSLDFTVWTEQCGLHTVESFSRSFDGQTEPDY